MDEAERRRLFDLKRVNGVCERNPGRRGIKPLKSVIAHAVEPPATREELERRFSDFCKDAKLPRPAFNVVVGGYEVDAAWVGRRLVAELDSWLHHGGRRSVESDRARDAALQVAGHRVVRVTWRRLAKEPARVARELEALLDG